MVLIKRGILSFLLKSKNPSWKGKKVVLNKPHILNIRGSVNNFASFFHIYARKG